MNENLSEVFSQQLGYREDTINICSKQEDADL